MELVRDGVPEILKIKGLNPVYRMLDANDHQRFDLIQSKFLEASGEAAKALKSGNAEDVLSMLANVMELVGVAAAQYKLNMNDVKQERDKKRRTKGGYDKFTVLVSANRLPY
jgi:predicted house-cleaning noncanonical NTP pyrophosphatase (MazG superfamily)